MGPMPVLTETECRDFLKAAHDTSHPPPLDWNKGHAVNSRVFYKIATHPAILNEVTKILGENVMLWGASIQKQSPNEIHPWHSDIESAASGGKTVSVWIGLKNINQYTSLVCIPYSHRFGETIQEVRYKLGINRHKTNNKDIVGWAKQRDNRSSLILPGMKEGEAIFFDGQLWHKSHNQTQDIRFALLLQYACPDAKIRIRISITWIGRFNNFKHQNQPVLWSEAVIHLSVTGLYRLPWPSMANRIQN